MQRAEPLFPQGPIVLEPVVDLGQRFWPQAVHPPLRLLAHVDKPGLAQHPQVPRYPRAGDREQRGQLTGGGLAAAQGVEHRPPAAIRQGLQDLIHEMNVPS